MENISGNGKQRKVLLVIAVLALAGLNASWNLGEKTLNNHECFVSITAREMLQSGDWVWPTCNGEPRLQKTPLSYWLVAGVAKITGKVDEFSTRLPSAVLGVLSVAAILYFVSGWFNFRIAVMSALVWGTSLDYIRYSHNGRPEMALTFFIILCFLSFYSGITAVSRKRQIIYMLIFWVSFGLANLAKGPAPIPLVILPLFFYIAICRQWKKIPKLLPIVGPIVLLCIVLPWPLAIANRLNWDLTLWKHEFVDRFFGNYAAGNKKFYYYLPRMFSFIAPWCGFLPMALLGVFYRVWNKKQRPMMFLWLWFVVDLVFITISGGKRQHYILPMMPAMAILIGILLEDMIFERRAFTNKFAANTLRWHVAVLIAGAVGAPIVIYVMGRFKDGAIHAAKTNSQLLIDTLVISAVTVVLAVIVAILFAKRKPRFACGAMFSGIVIWVMFSYVIFMIPLDYNRYSRDFSRKICQIVTPSGKLIAYKNVSNWTVHYFGRIIPVVENKRELYEHYQQGGWVVATAGRLEKIEQDGRFRMVYRKEKAERLRRHDVAGALFHKSAEIQKNDP